MFCFSAVAPHEEQINESNEHGQTALSEPDMTSQSKDHRDKDEKSAKKAESRTASEPFFQRIRGVLTKDVLGFLLPLVAFGFAQSSVSTYLIMYLSESKGIPRSFSGLVVAFSNTSELAFFFLAERVSRRFGAETVLRVSHLVYAVRLLGFVVLPGYLALLPQLLQGPSYGAMWHSAASLARLAAPHGLVSTLQGLVSSFYYLGYGFGALTGGFISQYLGTGFVFAVCAHPLFICPLI